MSHSIDGGRDEFGDDEYGAERAPRGRRSRVIVDDNYGAEYGGDLDESSRRQTLFDDNAGRYAGGRSGLGAGLGGDDEPRGYREPRQAATRAVVPRSERSRGRRASRGGAPSDNGNGGGATIVFLAIVASIAWVAGVFAFAAGLFELPIEDFALASEMASTLPARAKLMTAALAFAPLGFVWLAAATARRAQRVSQEAARLRETVAVGGSGGGDVSGQLGGLADFEESVAAIEERASAALARLEQSSSEIATLIREFEQGSERLAAQAAAQLSAQTPAQPGLSARAPAASSAAPARPAPRQEIRPEPPANDAIARAAEAARGAMSGAAAAAAEPDGDRATRIDALRRRLESRGPRDEAPIPDAPIDHAPDLADEAPLDDAFDDFDDHDPVAAEPEQAATPTRTSDLDWSKLVRAANFPDSEDDRETLDALYAVLTDPEAAALLQSAEDALSALADIDYYMEDMTPHHAPAELWRSYIVDGDRRNSIDLGGIRDTHAIEDVVAAFERNPDFAPAAERFMDRYEGVLDRLFAEAPSTKLAVELADTRSGRAYMLLARAAGRFG